MKIDSVAIQNSRSKHKSLVKLKAKHANDFFDQLAPELFFKIMVCLTPREVRSSALVCRRWKTLLSTDFFWRSYVRYMFNFDDVTDKERLTGMLHELGSEWYIGWGAGKVPGSLRSVFEEIPKRWRSGIIHPLDVDIGDEIENYKTMFVALHRLHSIQQDVEKCGIVYTGNSRNRGECPIDVFLFPWHRDQLPSPDQIIKIFRFNPRLNLTVTYQESTQRYGDEERQFESIFKSRYQPWYCHDFCDKLKEVFHGFAEVCIDFNGRQQASRPQPVIVLSQISTGWCGGVLTGVW